MYFLFLLFVTTVFASTKVGKCNDYSLGKLTNITRLPSCPSNLGFSNNTVCTSGTVICPDTLDTNFVYGKLHANCTSRGTAVLINGGGSTSAFNNGYVDIYLDDGLDVIQLVFTGPGGWNPSGVGRQNLKAAACRTSTIYEYLFEVEHGGDRTRAFCGHGHSGGAASLGYYMTTYGGDKTIDYVLLSAGPIFSAMREGCEVPIAPQIRVCPPDQNYCGQVCESFLNDISFVNTFAPQCVARGIALTGYPCACPNMTSTAEELVWWEEQSIVNECSDLKYQFTGLSSWQCEPPVNNVAPGQSQVFAESVHADSGFQLFLVANCSGAETIWNSTFVPTADSGLKASAMAFIAGCVPHHDDCDTEC